MTLTFKGFSLSLGLSVAAALAVAPGADAAGSAKHPKHVEWETEGPFGHFDIPAAQRGWQVFREVCAACHSLDYFRFRNLADIGYEENMIKAFAAEYEVAGEPDDFGDPTTRAGLPQDPFPSPFANENAARAANGGALPPDLSLIVKARHDGANYVYSLLTGYESAPADVELSAGRYYNPYFKGGQISMAPPLADDLLEYEDGTEASSDQMARDLVNFLIYVAEPNLQSRHQMGISTMLFLLLLAVLLYFSKKQVWKPIKQGKNVYEDL